MSTYADFLATKIARVEIDGPDVPADDIHPMLHAWQNELVRWAVRTSRAALWADTGLGKTVRRRNRPLLRTDRGGVMTANALIPQGIQVLLRGKVTRPAQVREHLMDGPLAPDVTGGSKE